MKKIKRSQIENELTTISKEFLKSSYDIDLTIPVKVNKRLSSALGRFRYYKSESKKRPLVIELSGRLLEYGTGEQILSTLKHECIHYALYMLNLPHKDGQATFENELKKHKSCSTGTQSVTMKMYVYSCGCDGKTFKSLTNRYNNKYYCVKCNEMLKLDHIHEPQPLRKIV